MEEFEFTRYVVPLRDRMFRYAQSLLLCADEAEDVTHDLLERLWRECDRLDGCRDVASFVMVAVRNCCYDRFRSRQAGERRDNAVAGWAERSTTGDAEGWEARDLVRRAMACLPEKHGKCRGILSAPLRITQKKDAPDEGASFFIRPGRPGEPVIPSRGDYWIIAARLAA